MEEMRRVINGEVLLMCAKKGHSVGIVLVQHSQNVVRC